MDETLARKPEPYRKTLAAMPVQTDDPGGIEELAAEMEAWAPLRRRAVAFMLDDEDGEIVKFVEAPEDVTW